MRSIPRLQYHSQSRRAAWLWRGQFWAAWCFSGGIWRLCWGSSLSYHPVPHGPLKPRRDKNSFNKVKSLYFCLSFKYVNSEPHETLCLTKWFKCKVFDRGRQSSNARWSASCRSKTLSHWHMQNGLAAVHIKQKGPWVMKRPEHNDLQLLWVSQCLYLIGPPGVTLQCGHRFPSQGRLCCHRNGL